MEKLYSDRLEDFYGLLAHHFTLAGFSDKAIEYTRMAAKQAVSLFAYEEAAQNLKSALSMVRADERPEIRILIYEELGDIYYLQRDLIQAITTYNQAIDWLENQKLFGPNEGMRIHRKIVQCSSEAKWNMDLESYRQARKISEHSRQRLEACVEESSGFELDPEQVRAMATLSFEAWRNQEPPQWEMAQEFAQAAVDKAEELDEPTILARALGALASVLDGRSMMREHALIAQRRLEASLDPRIKDDGEHLSALCGAGMALMYVGEYDQALPMLEEAELLAVTQHNIGQQVAALGLQSQCYFRMDRWDDVLDTEIKWRDLERRFSRQRVGPT